MVVQRKTVFPNWFCSHIMALRGLSFFSLPSTAGHSPLTHYPTARRIYYQPCYEGISYFYSLLPHDWHPSFFPSSSSSDLLDSHLENVYGAPHARTRSAFPLPTSGLVPFSALTSKSAVTAHADGEVGVCFKRCAPVRSTSCWEGKRRNGSGCHRHPCRDMDQGAQCASGKMGHPAG